MNESCTHCRPWLERQVSSSGAAGATRAVWLKGRRRQRLPAPWAKAGKNIFIVDAPAWVLSPKESEREFGSCTWVCCCIKHAGAAVFLKARTTNHTFWIELVQPVGAPSLTFSAIFHMGRSFVDGPVWKMRFFDFNAALYGQIEGGNICELAAQCRDRMSGLAAGAHDLRWRSRGIQAPAECRSSLDCAF